MRGDRAPCRYRHVSSNPAPLLQTHRCTDALRYDRAMQSEDAIELLKSLLHETRAAPSGAKEGRFRAKHVDQQDLIDALIYQARIQRKDGCLILRPLAIAELAPTDPVAANLHARSGRTFHAIREHTRADPDARILIEDLAAHLKMFRSDLIELLNQLADAGIFTTYELNSDKAYVQPSTTTVFRYKNYDELIEQARRWAADNTVTGAIHGLLAPLVRTTNAKAPYVDAQRLDQLRSINSIDWDLTRLIRLCEELNIAHEHKAWMTCAMLARGIVDHVPPILSCSNFAAVANNYAGARSFRQHMQHLDNSLRRVADAHLHIQIRTSEALPTFVQVDFRSDLDALLAEVVRLLK